MVPDATAPKGEARPRLLLVDDEPLILQALERELRLEKFAITAHTDPLEGQAAFATESFDIVISDNMMPSLTGLELLQWVKQQHPQTRRVLLTGRTDLNHAVKAFNDGVIHHFLSKPWNKQELLAIIRQELEQVLALRKEQALRDQLVTVTRRRTVQLQATLQELKEARTQLFMHAEAPSIARMALSIRLRTLSYLVVEEHAGIRDLLVTTLKKAGISRVESVESSSAALEFIQSTPMVDVILSEWKMTGIDGLDLFRAIRHEGSHLTRAIFILLTTQENREAVEFALRSGVDGYVLKPFHLQSLFNRIEESLHKRHKENLGRRIQELRPLSIIVANGEMESRIEIQHLLTAAGVQNVAMADSGQKALRWMKEKNPDVLIYDCNIRDPYWLDLEMTLLREDPSAILPPLVLTSVAPMQKEYEEVYKVGLPTFLPGTVQRRDLLQAILRARDLANERT